MSPTSKQSDPKELPEKPQSLIGFMPNDEWDELLVYVNGLIEEVENLPLPEVKEKVFELLAGIDTIHREGLWRLVRLFKEGVLETVVTDPAIHTLMELYDLLPPEKEQTKPAINFPDIPIKVIPTRSNEKPKQTIYPHWFPALKNKEALATGQLQVLDIADTSILLCRIDNDYYAVTNQCAQDRSSLSNATLSSYTLSCPNHTGCLYDIRQGTRIAGQGEIECYPVKVSQDDSVMIGLGMEFVPNLPTF